MIFDRLLVAAGRALIPEGAEPVKPTLHRMDMPDPELMRTMDLHNFSTETQHQVSELRRKLDEARTILVVNTDIGMGDDIMCLRARRCIAAAYPGKITHILHPALHDLAPHLEISSNPREIDLDSVFVLDLATVQPSIDRAIQRVQQHFGTDISIDTGSIFSLDYGPVYTDMGKFVDGQPVMSCDADLSLFFLLACTNAHQHPDLYRAPVIDLNPREYTPTHALLLIPDAGGQDKTTNRTRSLKSPTPSFWETHYFRLLSSSLQGQEMIISIGTAHPQYCLDVAEAAKRCGIHVRTHEGSLYSLLEIALNSRRIITTDNGVAHGITETLLHDTRVVPPQTVLQVFSSLMSFRRFGTRGLGEHGMIAYYEDIDDWERT